MTSLRRMQLPLGAATCVVGTGLLAVSLLAGVLGMGDAVGFWVDGLSSIAQDWRGWNQVVLIVSPLIAITGGWYAYEQISARRRFEEIVSTRKKSAFVRELSELEALTRRLPPSYRERLQERKDEFNVD